MYLIVEGGEEGVKVGLEVLSGGDRFKVNRNKIKMFLVMIYISALIWRCSKS